MEKASERLLIIKTRASLVEPLFAKVKALHSYEVPEFIVLPITAGSPQYLSWLNAETAAAVKGGGDGGPSEAL